MSGPYEACQQTHRFMSVGFLFWARHPWPDARPRRWATHVFAAMGAAVRLYCRPRIRGGCESSLITLGATDRTEACSARLFHMQTGWITVPRGGIRPRVQGFLSCRTVDGTFQAPGLRAAPAAGHTLVCTVQSGLCRVDSHGPCLHQGRRCRFERMSVVLPVVKAAKRLCRSHDGA